MTWTKLNLESWLGAKDLKVVDISPARGSSVVKDSTPAAWNTIKFQRVLYGSDAEDYQSLYYTITLSEQLEHLFPIMENFNFMNLSAKAMAVAKITHYRILKDSDDMLHGPSLYQQMKELRDKENYLNWWQIYDEYRNQTNEFKQKNYGTTDLMTIARSRSVQAKGNEYVEGNTYRTKTLTLSGWSKAAKENGGTQGNVLDQRNLDNLFIDFKIDISKNFSGDKAPTSTKGGYNLNTNNSQISNAEVLKYRIHDLINVGKWNGSSYEYVYKVREDKDPPDPLYIYIESEDYYNQSKLGQSGSSFNTVHQMILNVNAANTAYDDRPMFFFYDGPEKATAPV